MSGLAILGPLQVGDGPVKRVQGQAGRALAVLVLQGGHTVPTADLAGWALGEEQRDASDRVHVLVARLRRLLRVEWSSAQIVTSAGGYRLTAPEEDIDAVHFAKQVVGARGLTNESAQRQLSDALAIWRGDPAEGLGLADHPSVVQLVDLRLTAMEDLFSLQLAAGHFRDALPDASAQCRRQPQRERFVALAMVGLYRAGRHAEALDLLHEVRTALREERGLDPGPQLQALEVAILRHDVDAWETAATTGTGFERLAAVGNGPGPAEPAPNRERGGSGRVPTPLSSFVGRNGDVANVTSMLATARVVTLTGVGGVGKTRLAQQVSRGLGQEEGAQVRWCELAPVGDPGAVVGVVAAVFGLVPEADRPLIESLAGFLVSKPCTLVLDNCEHVLDAVAEIVEELCGRCATLRVLATSREPLGIFGEQVHAVRPLSPADAVVLFSDRARAVRAGFEADDSTIEICRRLDGIPLALEMAAARLRSMQPIEIAARLDERFRLLVGGRRAVPRQQTLRATVEWSHDLLDARERLVFRRLAVFAGSFSRQGADDVATDDRYDTDVDEVLDSLVSKSLVVADAAPDGTTRFWLLETIRQFAQERLIDAGEADERRRRHALFFARFVKEAGGGLRGPEEARWADRVAEEFDNLRAASQWALAAGDADLALGLFAPLSAIALAEPTAYEMFGWIEPSLALAGATSSRHRWRALVWVTARAANIQEFTDLGRHHDALLRDVEAMRRPEVLGLCGMWHHARSELEDAARCHMAAAEAYAGRGDEYDAVRHSALALWCRPDDDIADDLELLADRARVLAVPYVTAFGLGAATCSPRYVLRDPARVLELLDEASRWSRQSRNPFLHRAFSGARILALTLLGDPSALREAREAIIATRNLNQIAVPVGALSVAFAVSGRHGVAAELIGAAMRSPTVYHPLQASPRVTAIWQVTRDALGEQTFQAAVARGSQRNYDELVSWLAAVLSADEPA